jgi:hypothetical protein
MAEEKEIQSLLCDDLPQAERVMLAQTKMTPGWKIVEKIANAACLRFQQETFKVNPEDANADRKVVERQRRARNITEFSDLFFKSIYAHVNSIAQQEAGEEQEAVSAVGELYGIHSAKKGEPLEAIKKTFGAFPARPKKEKKS